MQAPLHTVEDLSLAMCDPRIYSCHLMGKSACAAYSHSSTSRKIIRKPCRPSKKHTCPQSRCRAWSREKASQNTTNNKVNHSRWGWPFCPQSYFTPSTSCTKITNSTNSSWNTSCNCCAIIRLIISYCAIWWKVCWRSTLKIGCYVNKLSKCWGHMSNSLSICNNSMSTYPKYLRILGRGWSAGVCSLVVVVVVLTNIWRWLTAVTWIGIPESTTHWVPGNQM